MNGLEDVVGETPYVPLDRLLTDLRAAARGVARISVSSRPAAATAAGDDNICTGWLITGALVVVPGFAATGGFGRQFRCAFDDGGVVVDAELVHTGSAETGSDAPALLALPEPMPDRVLELHTRREEPGHQVLLVHHPLGVPEARLSFGRVLGGADDGTVRHDTPTEAGSSGAPLLVAGTMRVLGMHEAVGGTHRDIKVAVSLSGIVDGLRESAQWPLIVARHQLVDVARPPTSRPDTPSGGTPAAGPDPALTVALSWSVDPVALDPATLDAVLGLVGDPDAPLWSLPGEDRRRLIQAAGSVDTLRRAAPAGTGDGPGQRTIDRILAGPPFDLDTEPDGELPYWLQAIRWFDGVVSGLPTTAEVSALLARRRVRGRLAPLVGSALWGREPELATLRAWYDDDSRGPLAVTGIGGVGKSALVARFALDLPATTVLLWLDFDRPDVAADDSASVLDALAGDAAAQLGTFDPPDGATAVDGEHLFGAAMAAALPDGARPLLVLDGFEIAQHAPRHEELWSVLDAVGQHLPGLRVIVSGRAPVEGVELNGREIGGLHLTGLPDRATRAWLADRGVSDPEVVDRILDATGGVPLLLRLALRLIEAGGQVALPAELPRALVDGYLYQRILERVVDIDLRPLARDALQLRRISADLIGAVLADRLPAGVDAATAFTGLSRELALVESTDPGAAPVPGEATGLRMRPELRAATLWLLEEEDEARVRLVDRRAADWYAARSPRDDATTVELVYHLLRLGDTSGAGTLWSPACLVLRAVVDEIPETFPGTRDWLRSRTGDAASLLAEWERAALERVRNALRRGVERVVPQILGERTERSPDSPLTVYDAWARWSIEGDRDGATAILDGRPFRDRTHDLLLALLIADAGERRAADHLLELYDLPGLWADRPDGYREALAVRAARVRLTVDLDAELALLRELREGHPGPADSYLTAGDVLLPGLSTMLGQYSTIPADVPRTPDEFPRFVDQLNRARLINAKVPAPPRLAITGGTWPSLEPWTADELSLPDTTAANLAVLARRRWLIATRTTFLHDAATLSLSRIDLTLSQATIATLAVFRGEPLAFPVDDGRTVHGVDGLLEFGDIDNRFPLTEPRSGTDRAAVETLDKDGWVAATLYLRGPDPLDALVRRLLDIPDRYGAS